MFTVDAGSTAIVSARLCVEGTNNANYVHVQYNGEMSYTVTWYSDPAMGPALKTESFIDS
jgi:hypothetical protein